MEIELKIARIEELRRLVASTPTFNIALDEVQVTLDGITFIDKADADEYGFCGSICCVAGLAWLHPPFIEQGIRSLYRGLGDRVSAAEVFFKSRTLFYPRLFKDSEEIGMIDKEVALRRIDAHLAELSAYLADARS